MDAWKLMQMVKQKHVMHWWMEDIRMVCISSLWCNCNRIIGPEAKVLIVEIICIYMICSHNAYFIGLQGFARSEHEAKPLTILSIYFLLNINRFTSEVYYACLWRCYPNKLDHIFCFELNWRERVHKSHTKYPILVVHVYYDRVEYCTNVLLCEMFHMYVK